MNNRYYGMRREYDEETKQTVAKEVTVRDSLGRPTDEKRYFIKSYNGVLVNPESLDYERLKKSFVRWKKVDAKTFECYTKFLESGSQRYLTYANRGLQS